MKKIDTKLDVVDDIKEERKKGTCGCGRSPTGDCCGWHALSEDVFRQRLAEYDSKQIKPTRQFNAGLAQG